jgi:hypothetical protein
MKIQWTVQMTMLLTTPQTSTISSVAPKQKKFDKKHAEQSTWKWRSGDLSEDSTCAGMIADKPRFLLVNLTGALLSCLNSSLMMMSLV